MMGVQDTNARLVALMHDLIEDTPVTLEELRALGFEDEVLAALDLVTHKQGDSYADYVIRLKANEVARQVKLSDLRDNSAISRVLYREDRLPKDLARIQRYVLSYQFLTDRIPEAEYSQRMLEFDL